MITSTIHSAVYFQQRMKQLLLSQGTIGLTSLLVACILLLSPNTALAQCELTLTPANIRSATCGGSDGSFNVQVDGIVAPYQYVLYKEVNGNYVQQESGTLIAGTPTFVFITGGTYKVAISKEIGRAHV